MQLRGETTNKSNQLIRTNRKLPENKDRYTTETIELQVDLNMALSRWLTSRFNTIRYIILYYYGLNQF